MKKGTKSVGVQRQYGGTAGRIENCQIGVFLGHASRYGHALIDRTLDLPEGWAGDPARRSEAGVPAEVAFATKPKLARAMPARAHAAGVPCAWVTADSVHGADHALRRWLQDRALGYALAVTGAQRLGLSRVDDLAGEVPAEGWHRLSAGEGSKGPRLYDWAHTPYARPGGDADAGWEEGLLIRRKLDAPDELAFYLTHAPAGTTLADLVRVAGSRWTIESCFEAAKGEVGLDRYEARSWTGWHRHVTLALLAHAYLVVVRTAAVGGRGDARPRRGPSAADRTGGAASALAPGLGAGARSRCRPGLVTLAPPSPAARPPLPLAPTAPPA